MKIRARYLHIIESVANVIVGYLINLLLVYLLLHSLGYNIQLNENAKMGAILVSVSLLRGYYIRRIFNNIVRRVYETT